MKRYTLKCLKCGEEGCVTSNLAKPDELFCSECEEELDLGEILEFVRSWGEWIADFDEMLAAEKAAE